MLTKLITLALCCQFSVSVESIPAFTVTVEAPPAPEVKPQRKYLAAFVSNGCPPCESWKQAVLPKLRAAGYHVELINLSDPAVFRKYSKRVSLTPSFAVIDYDTGQWLSDVTVGYIDQAAAVRMLDGPADVPAKTAMPSVSPPALSGPPARYIQWPGWGTIDLETYDRDCNCTMCVSIRAMQNQYWIDLKAWQESQASVSADQKGCPYDVVETMLDQAGLLPGDVLAEVGCGDGRILIAAARRGIRGIGIEIDPERADLARRNVQSAGYQHLVTVETGDALEFDFSRVTVATAFLYPPLLEKLAPKLRGLRVVASPFHQVPGLPMVQTGDVWIYRKNTSG